MSDFDKEAERERLREKYEADQEGREATQRMSELLLKGATMTNKHCGNCGDPVFRHDGTEFCPSCNADGGQAVENPEDAGDVAAAAEAADVDADAAAGARAGQGAAADAPTGPAANAAGGSDTPSAAEAAPSTVDSEGRPAPSRPTDANAGDATPQRPVAGDDAVANVEATLERFAALAADTDDPGRARECLAVVKEAAETLDALGAGGR